MTHPARHSDRIGAEAVQRLWQACGLGDVTSISQPARGKMNICLIVNENAIARFAVTSKSSGQFRSEQIAYDRLRGTGVPVPDVLAFDQTRTSVPFDALITTRLPGEPVIDSWAALPLESRAPLARDIGRTLAVIHETCAFDRFGPLHSRDDAGFGSWYEYVADYTRRHAAAALDLALIDTATRDRITVVLSARRPLLDRVRRGVLVHGDYHFENLLQDQGRLTGVIDFEWALAGDPAWDFHMQPWWDDMCPGSAAPLLDGYASLRPFAPDHDERRTLYTLVFCLEALVDCQRDDNQPGIDALSRLVTDLLPSLEEPTRS